MGGEGPQRELAFSSPRTPFLGNFRFADDTSDNWLIQTTILRVVPRPVDPGLAFVAPRFHGNLKEVGGASINLASLTQAFEIWFARQPFLQQNL